MNNTPIKFSSDPNINEIINKDLEHIYRTPSLPSDEDVKRMTSLISKYKDTSVNTGVKSLQGFTQGMTPPIGALTMQQTLKAQQLLSEINNILQLQGSTATKSELTALKEAVERFSMIIGSSNNNTAGEIAGMCTPILESIDQYLSKA